MVTQNVSEKEFWREWPKERADELTSDLFVAAAEDDAQAEKFRTDPVPVSYTHLRAHET